MRSPILGAVLLAFFATSCKTGGTSGQSDVKEIADIKKVTLVQGSDQSGNAVAFITCAPGFIDKLANKAEFALPWKKVANMTYSDLEQTYCTVPTDGSVVVGPGGGGGGGPNPPGGGGGGGGAPGGDAAQLDASACKSQEGSDLPNLIEIKRIYLPPNVTESYDRCVVFGEELEGIFKILPVYKKAFVDRKIRIYAVNEDTFAYDDANKKLTVPVAIKGKIAKFIEVAAPILGGNSASKIVIFPSNKGLLWTYNVGTHGWTEAKAYCDSLGAPWSLPTFNQLNVVSTDLNQQKVGQLVGTTSGNYSCVQIAPGPNQYACNPYNANNSGTYSDMSNFCVIDGGGVGG